eukprot:scaffold293681_cov39-Prasinocladus_malaysianus.AAC.1
MGLHSLSWNVRVACGAGMCSIEQQKASQLLQLMMHVDVLVICSLHPTSDGWSCRCAGERGRELLNVYRTINAMSPPRHTKQWGYILFLKLNQPPTNRPKPCTVFMKFDIDHSSIHTHCGHRIYHDIPPVFLSGCNMISSTIL